MPEYLSPGVYVEEVDTGSKPIEGVSTSTAGMLGVTERGPANVPILITSTGEFDRWFGGKLDRSTYSNTAKDPHCYLPDAVEGFFANGGKRVYVTRVEADSAAKAETMLHTEPAAVFASTTLLRSAGRGAGLAAEPLVVLENANINSPDILRIGNGSASEYPRVAALAPPVANATIVVLNVPFRTSVTAGTSIATRVPLAAPSYAFRAAATPGANTLLVDASAAPAADEVPVPGHIVGFKGHLYSITAVRPLLAHRFDLDIEPSLATTAANNDTITLFVPPIAYKLAAKIDAGHNNPHIVAASAPGAVPVVDEHITIGGERCRIDTVTITSPTDFTLTVTPALASNHAANQPVVVDPPDKPLSLNASAGSPAIVVTTSPAFNAGTVVVARDAAGPAKPYLVTVPHRATLTTPLPGDTMLSDPVRRVRLDPPVPALNPAVRTTSADAAVGATHLELDARTQFSAGQLLQIGAGPDIEYRVIRAVPAPDPTGLDPGRVVLDQPLRVAHLIGTTARVVVATPTDVVGTILAPGAAGTTSIALANSLSTAPNPLAAGDFLEIEHVGGAASLVTVAATAAVTPDFVVLNRALEGAHAAGDPVIERVELLGVTALDSGIWGDRLRVAVEDERVGLVAPTGLKEMVDPNHIRLVSPVGVEPGTVLELLDRNGILTDALLKVTLIDHQDQNLITLADPLTAFQQAEIAAAGVAHPLRIRSLEFRLTVELLHQPDAARPRRNELVIASEVFPHLSMDPRHSRYVQTVIGDSDPSAATRLFDRRSFGDSRFIRVRDVEHGDPPPANALLTRVGPEALVDILPTGVRRPARLAFDHGDDLISTIDDNSYIGLDSVVPEDRTGLQSFRNIDAISILGCPGRTSPTIQTALINHCEELRYRFAVLDSVGAPNDTITDVQVQRQNYDTKYAALYYPWLMVPEVFPSNLATFNQEPIPPSGHMLGLYARIDNERGVHKAPANEVVRGGIVDLRRTLNKGEHDILNPYPTNINVIRDFRPNNRAIRVYGARVITSDPDWKYVNVRRLLIFIEKSIDLGLQWVVFEPNAEPLWARVKRSVSQFLITVWRNGALEGTTKEEAFFVKCDRSTMTQADIDNGRLIIEVGVAPVKPAEFVIVRIGLFTAHADD